MPSASSRARGASTFSRCAPRPSVTTGSCSRSSSVSSISPRTRASTSRSCSACASAYRTRPSQWATKRLSGAEVIRSLFGDDYVVHVTLAQSLGGDPDEARLGAKLLNAATPGVTHAAPEPAHDLVENRRERSSMRHASLDPLGHEL